MDFSDDTIQEIWEKGEILQGSDPETWRLDDYGNVINRNLYKTYVSQYGWEIKILKSGFNKTEFIPVKWTENFGK